MSRLMGIPEEAKQGLHAILDLDQKTFKKLAQALTQVQPSMHYGELVSRIVKQVGPSTNQDIGEIVSTVIGLYSGTTSTKVTADRFIQDVAEAEDLGLTETKRGELRKRLHLLLGVEALEITSKALNVFTDHDKIFTDARIITDIRPVFKKDPEEVPSNGVVVHMLKIVYKENMKTMEFFVALDSNDLTILQGVTERAIKKEKSTVEFLTKAGMNVLS